MLCANNSALSPTVIIELYSHCTRLLAFLLFSIIKFVSFQTFRIIFVFNVHVMSSIDGTSISTERGESVTHEVRVIILRDGIVDLIVFIFYITFGN